jgi:hypothetical protein
MTPVMVQAQLIPEVLVFLAPMDIGEPGHEVAVEWKPAAGATAVEVNRALLTIYPAVAEEVHADVPLTQSGQGWVIAVPTNKRVKKLTLNGFKFGEDNLTSASDLPAGMRVAVAFPPPQGSGFDAPRFSIPEVGWQGAIPPTLTGATFSNKVVNLNRAVEAAKVRIALVSGSIPSEFADQPSTLQSVTVTTHATAREAKVTGPDGTVHWQMAEIDPEAAPSEVDIRFALEAAFSGMLGSDEPLKASFLVSASVPARATVNFSGASGFLARTEEGVLENFLEGDPVAVELGGPLADETPASVTGDLTIRYSGIRILETVSDPLPAATAPVSGAVVGTQPALRVLPPQALKSLQLARIGVFGRAPEDCELSIELVEVIGDTVGETLSSPAVIEVTKESRLRTHWADLPANVTVDRPAGIRVRANRGRFFWASNEIGDPSVHIAIHDPDPGGRTLHLGESKLKDIHDSELREPGFFFPVNQFRSAVPELRSNLFLEVDLSDLTMRYAR